MNTNGQVFFDNLVTTGAYLRRVFGVNEYHNAPSLFRFGDRVLYELIPSHIGNALVDGFEITRLQICDVQVLKYDNLILIYKFATLFMRKIKTAICDALMNVIDCPLLPIPLRPSEVFLVSLKPALALSGIKIPSFIARSL